MTSDQCAICQSPIHIGPSGNVVDRQEQMLSTTPYFHYHITSEDWLAKQWPTAWMAKKVAL